MNNVNSDALGMFVDTAERLLGDLFWPDGVWSKDIEWPKRKWEQIEESGLPLALVPEEFGGFGLATSEALSLVGIGARHAVPVPISETMFANWLLAICGFDLPGGPLTVAIEDRHDAVDGNIGGELRFLRVPYGRNASKVAAVIVTGEGPRAALIARDDFRIEEGHNLAGEPRDTLELTVSVSAEDLRPLPGNMSLDDILACGAAMRVVSIAGAVERVLERSVQYAGERVQFGRPIGKFQAIQHSLAMMAGQYAMASAAANIASDAFGNPGGVLSIAAGKVVADEAAFAVARIAHQVHGAIGFTLEHPLHLYTMRLRSWCDEFGNGEHWATKLGDETLVRGSDGLWPLIVST